MSTDFPPKNALMVAQRLVDEMPKGQLRSELLRSLTPHARTSDQIRAFHKMFDIPIAKGSVESMSPEDMYRRLHMLIEEVLELVFHCGFDLYVQPDENENNGHRAVLEHIPESKQNRVEMLDALGDVNVLIHGFAIELGDNLDDATTEIHASNLTKMGEDGLPIVNGVNVLEDSQYPVGKILKGPNYVKPNLKQMLAFWSQR